VIVAGVDVLSECIRKAGGWLGCHRLFPSASFGLISAVLLVSRWPSDAPDILALLACGLSISGLVMAANSGFAGAGTALCFHVPPILYLGYLHISHGDEMAQSLALILAVGMVAVLMLADVREQEKTRSREAQASASQLAQLTVRDSLTRAHNQQHLLRRLEEEIDKAREERGLVSLLMVDLNNFARYNEAHGYRQGDRALVAVAAIIEASLREGDMVARFGGDEFAALLPGVGREDAERVGHRIQKAIKDFSFPGADTLPTGPISASVGVSVFPQSATSADDLLEQAMNAVLHARYMESSQVRVFESALDGLMLDPDDGAEPTDIAAFRTLLSIISAKDQYTYSHSERVLAYAVGIARNMNLNEAQIREIKYAAFLHDLGKIEIRESILKKPARLNPAEWELMRQHPVYAERILRPIRGMAQVRRIILHHHERWDGSGYPDGLAGESIPLGSRILAVADSFDAIRSERPYRPGRPLASAVEEIKRWNATWYDPRVVEAFLTMARSLEDAAPAGDCRHSRAEGAVGEAPGHILHAGHGGRRVRWGLAPCS